jgi:hypothetical protein
LGVAASQTTIVEEDFEPGDRLLEWSPEAARRSRP